MLSFLCRSLAESPLLESDRLWLSSPPQRGFSVPSSQRNSQCITLCSWNLKVTSELNLSWNLGPGQLGKSCIIYELQFLIHNIGLVVPISRVAEWVRCTWLGKWSLLCHSFTQQILECVPSSCFAGVQRCMKRSFPCSLLIPCDSSGDAGEHPESQTSTNVLFQETVQGLWEKGVSDPVHVGWGDSPKHCPPRGVLKEACQAELPTHSHTPPLGGLRGLYSADCRRLQGFKCWDDLILLAHSGCGMNNRSEGSGCSWGKGEGEATGPELGLWSPGKGANRGPHTMPAPSSAAPQGC